MTIELDLLLHHQWIISKPVPSQQADLWEFSLTLQSIFYSGQYIVFTDLHLIVLILRASISVNINLKQILHYLPKPFADRILRAEVFFRAG